MSMAPEAMGREIYDLMERAVKSPESAGTALDWSIVTVTARTVFPDKSSPPAPAVPGVYGWGEGVGADGEVQRFVFGSFTPRAGDRVLLVRLPGSVAVVEDVLPKLEDL